jgi:ELWxxDGT repeat protein
MPHNYRMLLFTLLAASLWWQGSLQNAEAQPVLVKDVNATQTHRNPNEFDFAPQQLVHVNGILYFVAYQEETGTELRRSNGTTAGTRLVKDIRPGTRSSDLSHLTPVNGTLFFVAEDTQLWKSDGTEKGTVQVKAFDSDDDEISGLTNVNGTLFFAAEGSNGRALYKSDGTENGTVLVKDGFGDPYDSAEALTYLTNVNGVLFFSGEDHRGAELWKSDGTTAGTVRVKDINPGGYSSGPTHLTAAGPLLYFTAYDDRGGVELWKSDGTAAGTRRVKDIYPGANSAFYSEDFTEIAYVNGLVFFTAEDGTTGYELWKSDGTAAGTRRVKDAIPGEEGAFPVFLRGVGQGLYFTAYDPEHGWELWKSDGTAAGTFMLKDIGPEPYNDDGEPEDTYPEHLVAVNGTLFFTASTPTHGKELWKSDGTASGTVLVKDIKPGSRGSIGNGDRNEYTYGTPAPFLTPVNGTLFLVAEDDKSGFELWRSDGSAPGTVNLTDLHQLSLDGFDATSSIAGKSNRVYFTATDGEHGTELWKSDGTAANTVLVKDIVAGDAGSTPAQLTLVNDVLFFTASDTIHGRELWRSDGTAGGTRLVRDIPEGADETDPNNLADVNGTLFFTHPRESGGEALWKSDGTAAGTRVVKHLTSSISSTPPHGMTVVNTTLYFFCPDDAGTLRIWRSDGTAGGTYPITSSSLQVAGTAMTRVGNTLYFVAGDGSHGDELWKSDGTEQGTVLVKDINPGDGNASPEYLTRMGNRLYFAATNDEYGRELWKSDGTEKGTVLVKDITEYYSSYPQELTVVNGTLFFTVYDDYDDRQLWKTDGTGAGTRLVKEIDAYDDELPLSLTNVNGTLCFVVNHWLYGRELWQSDGSEAGTGLVADLKPPGDFNYYYESSSPALLTSVGGTLYFAADDGKHGRELWKYNPAGCRTPADSVEVPEVTVCTGNAAAVVLRNTAAGVRYRLLEGYRYYVGPAVTGTGGDITIPLGFLPVGTYTYSVKAFGCTERILGPSADVNVLPPLEAPNANSVVILPGEAVTLYAEGAPEGATYHWYGQETGGAVLETGDNFTTAPLFAPAVYFVAVASPPCRESARTRVTVAMRQQAEGWFVNAGGRTYLSSVDKLYTADQYFRGGRPAAPASDYEDIEATDEDALYYTGRCGEAFSYHFPVPDGTYNVVLHFAETYWDYYYSYGEGKRQFHVDIEGQRKLTNYDIYARAGGSLTAVQETFRVQVTDGELVIDFRRGAADIPLVMALEVVPADAGLRINAGGMAYQSIENKDFVPDGYYQGGQASAYADDEIYNTSDDELYRTGRHGSQFKYRLPTGNGTFDVTLHFCETYWGAPDEYWEGEYRETEGGAGSRRFNVDIEGERKLTEYDIYEKAGGAMKAVRETFRVTVSDGQLELSFRQGSADNPSVKAIEVVPATGNARTATLTVPQVGHDGPAGGIRVYPNPVKDLLRIRTERPAAGVSKTVVTGMIGTKLLENRHRLAGPRELELDVSGLPAGVYAIRLRDGESWRTVKFVKQ